MPFPRLPPHHVKAGRRTQHAHALLHPKHAPAPVGADQVYTLSVDIGGTGIKMIVLDAEGRPINERTRWLTPQPASARAVLDTIREMLPTQPKFDRISVGFPGVVIHGVVHTAANLDAPTWKLFDLGAELARIAQVPVRVINDADLQGYGVIDGRGVELVLTLGTGLGSALFAEGRLVPNLELGHHPFKKGKTYEERVSDAELKRIGKKDWNVRVQEMLEQLQPIFNYNVLHLGGGNVAHLKLELPSNVHVFTNVDGMTGGIRLWKV